MTIGDAMANADNTPKEMFGQNGGALLDALKACKKIGENFGEILLEYRRLIIVRDMADNRFAKLYRRYGKNKAEWPQDKLEYARNLHERASAIAEHLGHGDPPVKQFHRLSAQLRIVLSDIHRVFGADQTMWPRDCVEIIQFIVDRIENFRPFTLEANQ